MRLQIRFLLLLIIVSIAGSSLLFVQQSFAVQRSKSVLASELTQRKDYFTNVINLEGKSQQQLAEDYSFWDDMVQFVQTNDLTFAHENLDTGLSTFGVDADWVYKPDGKLLYFSAADGSDTMPDLALPTSFFTALSKSKTKHFYQATTQGIIEVRAATIVPSSDPKHQTAAKGYWIIARLLTKEYISSIAKLSQSTVTVTTNSTTPNDSSSGDAVRFSRPLQSWDGKTAGNIQSVSRVAIISDLNRQYKQELYQLITLVALIVVGVLTALWLLVLRPIKHISQAIHNQNPESLAKIRKQHTEFGTLAQTIADFYAQKITLAETEERKRQLEELNKEKAAFLAVAAHELNTPVSNVKIFSEYLSFLITKNPTDPKISQQISRIAHQSIKINLLLNDLRSASQGNQELEVTLRDFNFDEFLQEEVAEAQFSNSSYTIQLTGSTGQTIHSDPDRLGQVVGNLIRNASKYSPDAKDISITASVADGEVRFAVHDNGVGIGEADKLHVFEKFYRATAVTGSFPGLGLGLYVSKSIVEKLDGKIWFDSETGKGTTFYVSIPITITPSS